MNAITWWAHYRSVFIRTVVKKESNVLLSLTTFLCPLHRLVYWNNRRGELQKLDSFNCCGYISIVLWFLHLCCSCWILVLVFVFVMWLLQNHLTSTSHRTRLIKDCFKNNTSSSWALQNIAEIMTSSHKDFLTAFRLVWGMGLKHQGLPLGLSNQRKGVCREGGLRGTAAKMKHLSKCDRNRDFLSSKSFKATMGYQRDSTKP